MYMIFNIKQHSYIPNVGRESCCGVRGPFFLACNHQWGLANQMIIPTIATPKISMEPVIDGQTYSNTTYARMLLDQVVKPTSTSRRQQNQDELQKTNMDISLETSASSEQQGQGFPPASQLTHPLASNSAQEQKRKASEMLQNHRVKRQRLNSAAGGSSTPPSLGLGASLPSQRAILPALQFQMDGMRLSPSLESPMSTSGSSRSTTVGLGEVRC
jgi:hypothetical protein